VGNRPTLGLSTITAPTLPTISKVIAYSPQSDDGSSAGW
jgi:hypothetical protein